MGERTSNEAAEITDCVSSGRLAGQLHVDRKA
jgi:hypothetical protein